MKVVPQAPVHQRTEEVTTDTSIWEIGEEMQDPAQEHILARFVVECTYVLVPPIHEDVIEVAKPTANRRLDRGVEQPFDTGAGDVVRNNVVFD